MARGRREHGMIEAGGDVRLRRAAYRRVDDMVVRSERHVDAALATRVAGDLDAQGANDLVRWIRESPLDAHHIPIAALQQACQTASLIESDAAIFDACRAQLVRLGLADAPDRDAVRAGRDIAAERSAVTGMQPDAVLRIRTGAYLERLLEKDDVISPLYVAERYFGRRGDDVLAARVAAYDDTQRAGIGRVLRARRDAGVPIRGEALLEELGDLPADPVVHHLNHRVVGPDGDAAAGPLVYPGIDDGYGFARWQQVAARRAEWPMDAHLLPLIPLHPEALDAWRAAYERTEGFAGWHVGVMKRGDAQEIFLVGALAAEPGDAVGVRLHLASAPHDADANDIRTRAMYAKRILAPLQLEPGVCMLSAEGAEGVAPRAGAGTLMQIINAPACRHEAARWHVNLPHDALSLTCPTCTRRALAVVPLHMAPGERPALAGSAERYLQQERFYAALRGEDMPDSFAALAQRDGTVSLELAEHLPHLAQPPAGRARDLSETLFEP